MTKLNGFESHAIITGLEMYKNTFKKEIANAEAAGKRPFITQELVDMQIDEVIGKVKLMTKKDRFATTNHN
jgi:hypothetical protein